MKKLLVACCLLSAGCTEKMYEQSHEPYILLQIHNLDESDDMDLNITFKGGKAQATVNGAEIDTPDASDLP